MVDSQDTAIITGGTGALGRTVCQALLEQGITVHASYLLEKELKTLPDSFRNNPKFCLSRVDLTQEDAVMDWFDSIGRFRILVNIAGGFAMAPIVETTSDAWRRMQDMNVTTVFNCCREALRRFASDDHGRIVNIGAFAALNPPGGLSAYTTAKAAVMNLTRALAEETLHVTTTVNALLPTVMDTLANREAMPDANPAEWVPTGAVADAILYLTQRDTWPITGALLPLRGHM